MGTEFILFNAIEVNCKQANLSSILVKWGVIPGGGGGGTDTSSFFFLIFV